MDRAHAFKLVLHIAYTDPSPAHACILIIITAGFRIALLIVIICLTLSALLVLGATIAVCLAFVCGCRRKCCSRRYEQLG